MPSGQGHFLAGGEGQRVVWRNQAAPSAYRQAHSVRRNVGCETGGPNAPGPGGEPSDGPDGRPGVLPGAILTSRDERGRPGSDRETRGPGPKPGSGSQVGSLDGAAR